MSQPKSHTHTHSATKGGQIFSHIWRMNVQNLNLLSLICLTIFFSVSAFMILQKGVSWWEFFDVYVQGYIIGHLKLLFLDPYKSLIVVPIDSISIGLDKLMGHKPKHFSSLFETKRDLVTILYVPKWSGTYVWQTLSFLKEPWVKSICHPINKCLYWGFISGTLTSIAMSIYFAKKGRSTEIAHILEGQDQVSESVLESLLGANKSDLKLSPNLSFVKGTETQHTLLVGSTGQGKTNRMMDILTQLRSQGKKAVVLDITGEFTSSFFRQGKDKLLNPLDVRTESWDVWSENLAINEYDAWAASMVPEGQGDPVWHESARKLLSTTASRYSEYKDRSMQKILNMSCSKPLDFETNLFYRNTPVSALMQKGAEKTTLGVRMNLSAGISAFTYLEESNSPFSITKWIAQSTDEWLFLTALPSQRQTLAPLLASWFNFSFLGLERCGPQRERQIWFIIDELPGLRYRIDALPRMVAEGRKYGACCLFGFQNKAQLDSLFGVHDSKAILSNCSTKVIFATPETQTAEYVSNTLGRLEVQESSENLSLGSHQMRDGVNLSQTRRIKPVVSSTEIMNLERFEAFVSLPGKYPIAKVKFPFVTQPHLTQAFVAKEFTQRNTPVFENMDQETNPDQEATIFKKNNDKDGNDL